MRQRPSLASNLLALTAGVLLPFVPLSAPAQSIPSDGVIYACIKLDGAGDSAKLVRIVAASEPCKKNEARIQWNVVGLVGPQGPVGAQGPAGPEGPAGPPGPTANVDALQAQVNGLQASLASLQTQVDALISSVGGDDGTAAALVGTWTGSARSVDFVRPVTLSGSPPQLQFEPFFNVGDSTLGTGTTQYSFLVPILGFCPESGGYCGNKTISVNPDYLLARTANDPITFTIARDGMTLSGMVSQGSADVARLRGLVLSNNFFLLRACATYPGGPSTSPVPCPAEGPPSGPVVVYQGVGSLNRDRNRILFTGSALEPDGDHVLFNVGVTKVP